MQSNQESFRSHKSSQESLIADVTKKKFQIGCGARFLAYVVYPPHSCPFVIRKNFFKALMILLTYVTYCSFHLSRKPISIVKTVLHSEEKLSAEEGWAPFNHDNAQALFSGLDSVYLFSYAFGMFISGHLAERYDLRCFLFSGAILSAIFTAAFGFGFYMNIHLYWYYLFVQLFGGLFQSSGWPAVVTCLGNWCGKKNRGFVMGIWNSHVSVGNILGSVIAGLWVEYKWGLSFIIPAGILCLAAIVDYLFLVPFPEYVGCEDLAESNSRKATSPPPFHQKFDQKTLDTFGKSQDEEQADHLLEVSDEEYTVRGGSEQLLTKFDSLIQKLPVFCRVKKVSRRRCFQPTGDFHGCLEDPRSSDLLSVSFLQQTCQLHFPLLAPSLHPTL